MGWRAYGHFRAHRYHLNSTCMPHLVRLARSTLAWSGQWTVYLISNWILASCQPHRTNYGETLCRSLKKNSINVAQQNNNLNFDVKRSR